MKTTQSGNLSLFWLMLALCGSVPVLSAQNKPADNKPVTETGAATQAADQSVSTTLDYLFNKKAGDGTAAKSAQQLGGVLGDKLKALDSLNGPAMNDAVLRARYEKYLSTEEVTEEKVRAYQAQMDQVSTLLKQKKVFEAWQLLSLMGKNKEIDGGISQDLANRIEAIWNADSTNMGLARTNRNLEQEVERTGRNADMMAGSLRDEKIEEARKQRAATGTAGQTSSNSKPIVGEAPGSTGTDSGSKSGTSNSLVMPSLPIPSTPDGTMQLAHEYLKNLEARSRIRLNDLKMSDNMERAKRDFAEHIYGIFTQRRLDHVIIGADFYRRIFEEGEYPVDMARQVQAALEANRQVSSSIEVFRYKVGRNEIAGASARLQEAFVANEVHPEVLLLQRSLKEKVADFAFKLNKVQNLIEARDFASLEKVLADMKERYADFEIAKALSLVESIKLESQLRLGKAKLMAQQGDQLKAMEEFQVAAEAWPGNPDVRAAATTFFSSQDFVNQSVGEFDRLWSEENYRAIYDKQLSIAPAIKDDSKRQEQFKTALTKVKMAEMAAEKANLLLMNGDVFGAWETVELATPDWPNDQKLNKLRADLSGRGADFVSALNKAKEAEAKKEFGYSLSCYLNALQQYPASQIAHEAVKRLSQDILGKKS